MLKSQDRKLLPRPGGWSETPASPIGGAAARRGGSKSNAFPGAGSSSNRGRRTHFQVPKPWFALAVPLGWLLIASGAGGCATVRPEQRAVLADPVMQFESEPGEEAARQHVLENREGALGGTSIKGGGCGCN